MTGETALDPAQHAAEDLAALYVGPVSHVRHLPKPHRLRYRVFSLYADVDHLPTLAKVSRWFSHNRFNLFSVRDNDYLRSGSAMDGASIGAKVRALLASEGLENADSCRITMLTYPRLLGYAFNPLTVFYCWQDAHLAALVYEVRNTFGERCAYVYLATSDTPIEAPHFCEKTMHVSPFFERRGWYQFQLTKPGKTARLVIDYFQGDDRLLTAAFVGKRLIFSDRTLAALALRFPFMTVKVTAGIMVEAAKLWLKRLPLFRQPKDHRYHTTRASRDRPVSQGSEQP